MTAPFSKPASVTRIWDSRGVVGGWGFCVGFYFNFFKPKFFFLFKIYLIYSGSKSFHALIKGTADLPAQVLWKQVTSVSSVAELTLLPALCSPNGSRQELSSFPSSQGSLDFVFSSWNEKWFAVACQLSWCQEKFRLKLVLFNRGWESLM